MSSKRKIVAETETARAVLIEYSHGDRVVVVETSDRDAMGGVRWNAVVEYSEVGDASCAERATFDLLVGDLSA